MSHVFISYSHSDKDRAYARKLANYLLANGFDVWIDDRIDFGSNWERAIFKAIDGSSAIIVIMTPESSESNWVQRERQYAEKRHKQPFPFLLDGEVFPFYAPVQYYDVRGGKLPEQRFLEALEAYAIRSKAAGREVAGVAQQKAEHQVPQPIISRQILIFIAILTAAFIISIGGILGYTPKQTEATPLGGGNGEILFVSDRDGNAEIYSMNVNGTNVLRLTNDPGTDIFPRWSPDGTQITFQSDRDGNYEIYTMDANGSNLQRLTDHPVSDEYPTWSSDGTQIAFVSSRDGNEEIYVMEADGMNVRRRTENPAKDIKPAWSPDGTQIAFISDRDGNEEIYFMEADGTNVRRRTYIETLASNPVWSPDGVQIAFQSIPENTWQIFVMNADGNNPHRVSSNPATNEFPSWSPDGEYIAFDSNQNGNYEIYIMAANGSNVRRITNDSANDEMPSWHP